MFAYRIIEMGVFDKWTVDLKNVASSLRIGMENMLIFCEMQKVCGSGRLNKRRRSKTVIWSTEGLVLFIALNLYLKSWKLDFYKRTNSTDFSITKTGSSIVHPQYIYFISIHWQVVNRSNKFICPICEIQRINYSVYKGNQSWIERYQRIKTSKSLLWNVYP